MNERLNHEAGEPDAEQELPARLSDAEYIDLAIERVGDDGIVIGHRTARLIALQLHRRLGQGETALSYLAATGATFPERLGMEIAGEFEHATGQKDEDQIKAWCVQLGRYVSLFEQRSPVRGWYIEDLEHGPEYDHEGFCLDCRVHRDGPHMPECPRGGGEVDLAVVSEEQDTQSPAYNELDCCVACGEHISYPHQPGCQFGSAGD